MKIFVVIPLFNEKKHVTRVIRGVLKYGLPVIVVDDGSTDESPDLASKEKVTLLRHRVNLGKGAAMKTGAEFAFKGGADAVVFMDSDGQHNSENLNRFIEVLKSKKCDVVFGSRNLTFGVPLIRYLGNKFASVVVANLFRIYVSDAICGFRAMTKAGYEKVRWDSRGYGVEIEIIARVGKNKVKHCEVPVDTIYHDHTKGVTILDAFEIMGEVLKWKLTI